MNITDNPTTPQANLSLPAVPGSFAIVKADLDDLRTTLEASLGGRPIAITDLDSAKLSGGGSNTFTIGGPGGDTTTTAIEAVIVGVLPTRRRWSSDGGGAGGSNTLLCSSDGGTVGAGDPGGACENCRFRQWTADVKPECAARRTLFLMTPERLLPITLDLPTSSVGAVDRYVVGLFGMGGLRPADVITEFRALPKQGSGSIRYSVATLRMAGKLSDEQRAKTRAFAEFFACVIPSTVAPPEAEVAS